MRHGQPLPRSVMPRDHGRDHRRDGGRGRRRGPGLGAADGPRQPGRPAGPPASPAPPVSPAANPANPAAGPRPDGPGQPGLARERTSLAWTRTAISFAAVGGVVLKRDVVPGLILLAWPRRSGRWAAWLTAARPGSPPCCRGDLRPGLLFRRRVDGGRSPGPEGGLAVLLQSRREQATPAAGLSRRLSRRRRSNVGRPQFRIFSCLGGVAVFRRHVALSRRLGSATTISRARASLASISSSPIQVAGKGNMSTGNGGTPPRHENIQNLRPTDIARRCHRDNRLERPSSPRRLFSPRLEKNCKATFRATSTAVDPSWNDPVEISAAGGDPSPGGGEPGRPAAGCAAATASDQARDGPTSVPRHRQQQRSGARPASEVPTPGPGRTGGRVSAGGTGGAGLRGGRGGLRGPSTQRRDQDHDGGRYPIQRR